MTGLSVCTTLPDDTPKKGDLVVTSVPALPPPLKVNAIGGAAATGADKDDEAKVKGAGAGAVEGCTSGTTGGVLDVAPKEKDEGFSGSFFSGAKENGANRGFEISTADGNAVEVELGFAEDPKGNAGLTVSDVEAEPELGKGPKVKGRGDGVDCGGGTDEKEALGSSPNNEAALCVAEPTVDIPAVLGSNKGFGAIGTASGFFSILSLFGTSENGKLVVADGFSDTAAGLPNSNGRLEAPPLPVFIVAVEADEGLTKENDRDGGSFSLIFSDGKDPTTGLTSDDRMDGNA